MSNISFPPTIYSDALFSNTRSDRLLIKNNYISGVTTSWKIPTRAATTGNIILSGIQTIDDVLLVYGDRILVKNQIEGNENGIYIVRNTDWVRSNDLIFNASANGIFVYVSEGSINESKIFICDNILGFDIVGIDVLTFISIESGQEPGGTENSIQYNNPEGTFNGSSTFLYEEGALKMIIGEEDSTSIITAP
jgi:hypothetical protein